MALRFPAQTAIIEAQELSERFPDLSEYDVVEHVEHISGATLTERTPTRYAVLAAYRNASAKIGFDTLASYVGIDIRPPQYH